MVVSWRCVLIVAMITILPAGTNCTLTVMPDNAAAMPAGRVTFACRTDTGGSVRWTLRDLDTRNSPWTVYNGASLLPPFNTRFTVTASSGWYNLTITSTTASDPGYYTCAELSGSDQASALYTHVNSNPVCSSTLSGVANVVEGTAVKMQCNVSFNGSIWQRPQMTWYSSGDFVTNSSSYGNPMVAVWSIINFAAEPPVVDYSCITHFSTPYYSNDQPPNLSQFVPSLQWTYTPVSVPVVFIGAIQIIGLMDDNTVLVNESLTCYVDAHPPAVYKWNDLVSGELVNGPVIFFYELGPRSLQCSASNVHNGVTYNSYLQINVTVITICTSNPCQNGGTCQLSGDQLCTCAPGYTGSFCEIEIDECESDPCLNNATCNDYVDYYNCTCAPGWTGFLCDSNIDECLSSPCQNWGTCEDLVNGYVCHCRPGFGGTWCELTDSMPGPSIQVQFNGTMVTSYHIDSPCVRKYVQQFGAAFNEQLAITQSALDSRLLCQSMSLGTTLALVPFVTTNQIQSTVVEIVFSMSVNASINNAIESYGACSYEIGYYIGNHNNWRQPILSVIQGCPEAFYDPKRFDVYGVFWMCPS